MEDVDDKLFKKHSDGKDFNSFINEFDNATNDKDKEKVVKELKDINSFVEHYAQIEDDYTEYKNKLFDIMSAVDYFVYEYSKKWVINVNWEEHSKIIEYFMPLRKIFFFWYNIKGKNY